MCHLRVRPFLLALLHEIHHWPLLRGLDLSHPSARRKACNSPSSGFRTRSPLYRDSYTDPTRCPPHRGNRCSPNCLWRKIRLPRQYVGGRFSAHKSVDKKWRLRGFPPISSLSNKGKQLSRLNGGGYSLLRTTLQSKFPLTGKNTGNSRTLRIINDGFLQCLWAD